MEKLSFDPQITGFQIDTLSCISAGISHPYDTFRPARYIAQRAKALADAVREVMDLPVSVSLQAGLLNNPHEVADQLARVELSTGSGDIPVAHNLPGWAFYIAKKLWSKPPSQGLVETFVNEAGFAAYQALGSGMRDRATAEFANRCLYPVMLRVDSGEMERNGNAILTSVKRAGLQVGEWMLAVEPYATEHTFEQYCNVMERLHAEGVPAVFSLDFAHIYQCWSERGEQVENVEQRALAILEQRNLLSYVAAVELNPVKRDGSAHCAPAENSLSYQAVLNGLSTSQQRPESVQLIYEGGPRDTDSVTRDFPGAMDNLLLADKYSPITVE